MPIQGGTGDALIPADANRQMFDRIARRYDLLNRLLSLGLDARWRARAVDELAVRAGGRYLDLGAGTADVSIAVARRAEDLRVVGIDLSDEMLRIGRRKVQRAGLDRRVKLEAGDATRLEFPDGSFDGVIAAFCIRNVTDHRLAVTEARRVLKPGGRLVILELTRPTGLVRPGYAIYSRLVPLAGAVLSHRGAYRYLVESIRHFPRPERLAELMDQLGFGDVRMARLTGGVATVFVGAAAGNVEL